MPTSGNIKKSKPSALITSMEYLNEANVTAAA